MYITWWQTILIIVSVFFTITFCVCVICILLNKLGIFGVYKKPKKRKKTERWIHFVP